MHDHLHREGNFRSETTPVLSVPIKWGPSTLHRLSRGVCFKLLWSSATALQHFNLFFRSLLKSWEVNWIFFLESNKFNILITDDEGFWVARFKLFWLGGLIIINWPVQLFNMSFCITVMPTNTHSTKMTTCTFVHGLSFSVLLRWKEPFGFCSMFYITSGADSHSNASAEFSENFGAPLHES